MAPATISSSNQDYLFSEAGLSERTVSSQFSTALVSSSGDTAATNPGPRKPSPLLDLNAPVQASEFTTAIEDESSQDPEDSKDPEDSRDPEEYAEEGEEMETEGDVPNETPASEAGEQTAPAPAPALAPAPVENGDLAPAAPGTVAAAAPAPAAPVDGEGAADKQVGKLASPEIV